MAGRFSFGDKLRSYCILSCLILSASNKGITWTAEAVNVCFLTLRSHRCGLKSAFRLFSKRWFVEISSSCGWRSCSKSCSLRVSVVPVDVCLCWTDTSGGCYCTQTTWGDPCGTGGVDLVVVGDSDHQSCAETAEVSVSFPSCHLRELLALWPWWYFMDVTVGRSFLPSVQLPLLREAVKLTNC